MHRLAMLTFTAFGTLLAGCPVGDSGSSGVDGEVVDGVFLPDPEAVAFVDGIDNAYLPFVVGAFWAFEAETDEGFERIEVEVLAETRVVNGVTATVVRDTVTLDGDLIEDTWDWFAQDDLGNVWYLGEDTCEYEDGECVSTEGAWEWGVDGALPGIVMWAEPEVDGQPYYQEYYLDHAEDYGEVTGTGESVDVEVGAFDGCVKVHESSSLDLQLSEDKYFCPGVGLALETEGDTRVELVEYTAP